ncbi:hypothetical protein SAMN02745121_08264 [Nannocystis exedens]|uniref:Uncharacterized protein n=1 Tax=Nannocystis exedens TaxID=54 RepID=A0A1I2HZV5_9BACT|nr:hypothetical protein [Nannocystis exedens]PCC72006.1 hypothetical protein NAEX_05085 [Nannocystis exedens]SFF34116.1 hypothetical protein SAMN02745121_08264 [Nannocystis exedens]
MYSPANISSRARARALAGLTCAALFVLPERPAAALSCDGPVWESDWSMPGSLRDPTTEFPVDVEFWELRSCAYSFEVPSGCRLERGDDVIPVAVEVDGADHCDVEPSYVSDGNYPDAIVRYVPERPMIPNRAYVLACDANGPQANDEQGEYTVVRSRLDPAPAAAPGALDDIELEFKRGDDGCCATGSYLELRLDHEQPWLREGGYVEVLYDDGQVFAVDGPNSWSGAIEMPPTEGGLDLTPVAADGTRGETLRLDRGDYDRELIYIPCAVSGGNASPLALWLLAPLLWIGAHGRRRRAAGGAS